MAARTRATWTTSTIVACALALAPAASRALDESEQARLDRGEIVVTGRAVAGSSHVLGVARALIPVPVERLWRAVTDYAHYEEFMPFLEESSADPQPDGSVLSRQRLAFPRPIGERRLLLRFRSAIARRGAVTTYRVTWTSVADASGDVERGSFTLETRGERTLTTCEHTFAPSGVPAFLVNPQTVRAAGWILDGLRQHVRRSRYDDPPPSRALPNR